MKTLMAAMLLLFAAQQRLPGELQVSQIEDPRARNAGIVVIGGQDPVITNTQQLPATQIERSPQVSLTGRPFDVEFRGAPLRAALTSLAQEHGLNLVMPPDIEDEVTIDLNDVTLSQALDAILTPRGLQFTIDGNLLRVDRVQMETRTFTFNYITTARALSRSVTASSTAGGGAIGLNTGTTGGGTGALGGAGGGGSSSSVLGTEQTNLLEDVDTGLASLKSAAGRVVFNRMAGIIMVTDFPRNLDTIGLFLETIQNAVNRQVVIETRIVEVRLNEDTQAGINWTAVLGNALRVEQTLGTATAFQLTGTVGDFTAVISALKTHGTVNVRSAPSIATMNNQPAIIRVGTQDVFFTTTTQVDPRTGTIVQTAVTPSTINAGIVLDVTPQISEDGIIIMNIHPTITERTGQAVSPRGDTVPIVDVRESDNVVRVADGNTVVIAGLMSDRELETVNKVPLLGDIPFVGNLFKRVTKEHRKSDLVILLTPRVLDVRTAVSYSRERIAEQERLKTERKP